MYIYHWPSPKHYKNRKKKIIIAYGIMNASKSSSLSRDARKIMNVEQIFKRQEEKAKKKQNRHKHKGGTDVGTEESIEKNNG